VYRGMFAGKPVALKVLRVSVDDRESVKKVSQCMCVLDADAHVRMQAFCQEVVVWKRLSHPNILPFWGVSRASPFSLVSPWMSHGSIRSYIKQNPESDRKPWVSLLVSFGLDH
jgi:serine/threonine protein kinase